MADNSNFTTLTPSNTSSAGLGDDEFRSIKSQMLAFWQEEHYLLDGSASSAGEHKPGSARAYVGSSSQLSNPRTGAIFFNTSDRGIYVAESGSTFSKYLATDLYAATDSLNTWTDQQRFDRAVSNNFAFATRINSGNTDVFVLRVDGTQEWGNATDARDTNLYRGGANLLKSDDTLQVANLVVDSSISAPSAAFAVDTLTVGGGATVAKILSATKAITAVDVPPNSQRLLGGGPVAVTGAEIGDVVAVGANTEDSPGLNAPPVGFISNADEVQVYAINSSNATITVPAQTIRVAVLKF